jgi:hypothetical protein
MIKICEDLSLPAKACDDLVPVHICFDDLDRDPLLILLISPSREVDATHAPATELLESLVGPYPKLEALRTGSGGRGLGLVAWIHVTLSYATVG